MEVGDLEPQKDFEYRFEWFRNEAYITLNFTVEDKKLVNLTLMVLENHLLFEENELDNSESLNKSILSIPVDPLSIEFVPLKQEPKSVIDSFSKGGIDEEQFALYTAFVTNIVDSISFLASAGLLTGPLIHIKRCFKTIYSLRLVNANFGNMLEAFFETLSRGFEKFDTTMKGDEAKFKVKTRGKLSQYGISVLSNNYLTMIYTLYIISRMLSIHELLFRSKIDDMWTLSDFDLRAIIILDKVKTSLFLGSVYDMVFYSTHELLHHDLTVPQNATSKLSYCISFVILILVVMDLLRIRGSLSKLKITKLIQISNFQRTVFNIIESKVASTKEKWNTIKVEKMFLKELPYKYSAEVRFFVNGLNYKNCSGFSSLGINLFSILKALSMLIIINSLQVLPRVQITILVTIQVSYFTYLIYMVFRRRVFAKKELGYLEVISEFCILVFLVFGLIFTVFGRDGLSEKTRLLLQALAVMLIMVGTLFNIYFAIVMSIDEIFNFYAILLTTYHKHIINKKFKKRFYSNKKRKKKRAKANQHNKIHAKRKKVEKSKETSEEQKIQIGDPRPSDGEEEKGEHEESVWGMAMVSNIQNLSRYQAVRTPIASKIQNVKMTKMERGWNLKTYFTTRSPCRPTDENISMIYLHQAEKKKKKKHQKKKTKGTIIWHYFSMGSQSRMRNDPSELILSLMGPENWL